MLAKKERKALVCNDYMLITVARSFGIECIWLTSLLLKLVKDKTITSKDAKRILYDLVISDMRINVEVYEAICRKIDELYTK